MSELEHLERNKGQLVTGAGLSKLAQTYNVQVHTKTGEIKFQRKTESWIMPTKDTLLAVHLVVYWIQRFG